MQSRDLILFHFQYLRKQGAINLLQCCLTVKEKMDTFSATSVDSEIRFTGFVWYFWSLCKEGGLKTHEILKVIHDLKIFWLMLMNEDLGQAKYR